MKGLSQVIGLSAFVIDTCDWEIIAWSAVASAGISGEMVCDLMIVAIDAAS
jgi:transposase InsO family protein